MRDLHSLLSYQFDSITSAFKWINTREHYGKTRLAEIKR
nr:MAG TPA_asm: hypothetical protein [Caudoviricetes sp.]